MRTYIGLRWPDGTAQVEVEEDGKRRALPHPRLHSPTGLEWGYGGSGPSDCALSILADFYGETFPDFVTMGYTSRNYQYIEKTKAWQLHWALKERVVARLPHTREVGRPYAERPIAEVLPVVEEWRLTEDQVYEAVDTIMREEARCLVCCDRTREEQGQVICPNWRCVRSPYYVAEEQAE